MVLFEEMCFCNLLKSIELIMQQRRVLGMDTNWGLRLPIKLWSGEFSI